MDDPKIRARPWLRLLGAAAVAAIVGLALTPVPPGATRIIVAWDAGVAFYLGSIWRMMIAASDRDVRIHAQAEDASRLVIGVLLVGGAIVNLLAIGFVIHGSGQASTLPAWLRLTIAGVAIILSWLLIHTVFAIHYGHLYYGDRPDGRPAGGLHFPSDARPEYFDFAYFSFVIGMTFQVSDVAVTSRAMRRLVLLHGVIAFFFNTVIVALSVSIAAGLL